MRQEQSQAAQGPQPVERLYSFAGAAREIGCSDRTVRERVRRAGITLVRFGGGRLLLRESDLARLIQAEA